MSAENWRRVKTIYQRAIETAPEKRLNFLSKVCAGDDGLRREVEEMLTFENTSDDVFEQPVFDAFRLFAEDAQFFKIGEQIGDYAVLREIGRGGMGVVYLAERIDRVFEQKVALKIIKRGMDTDAILKRFVTEREILASLDHPNIARILDGGTTDDSLPYFVLEYVEGLPVDEFCDAENLSLNERLRLFRKICDTVIYAHQNLVVHRDLKPSNILINEKGEPKLLDFGIARLLNAEPTGETEFTETGKRLLTPEYASPEQIAGTRITTQSDVYSLGVLLSKLIENRPLFFVLCPSKEKTEFSNRQRTKDKEQRTKTELKAILQTALHEDLARRYSSVEQFSEDIRRYLEGLPVFARKDSFAYRTAKFVYRNQAAVFASVFMFLALVSATAFSIWQMRKANAAQVRAEQRFTEVRKLANSVLFDYHDKIENLSGSTEIRRQMLKDSLAYLDSLSQESLNDNTLLNEIGAAYLKIGDAQGKPFAANSGDSSGALESYRKAEQIFLDLTGKEPENREFQINLSCAFDGIGKIQTRQFDVDASIESHRKSLEIRETFWNENPPDNNLRELLAETLMNLGDATAVKAGLLLDKGDLQTAEKLTLESLELFRRVLPLRRAVLAKNQTAENLRRVSVVFQRIGFRLASLGEQKKDEMLLREGLQNQREALKILETARKIEPDNIKLRRSYADELMIIAEVLVLLKDFDEARQNYLQVQKTFEQIAAEDPTNAEAKRDLVNLFDRWGRFYVARKDAPEAIRNFRKAAQILGEVIKVDPTKSDEAHFKSLQRWAANAESFIPRQPKS